MPRYLFIGDVHGCIDELRELLDRAELREDDIVVSLGDLVRKGPDPAGCVRLIRERGATGPCAATTRKSCCTCAATWSCGSSPIPKTSSNWMTTI